MCVLLSFCQHSFSFSICEKMQNKGGKCSTTWKWPDFLVSLRRIWLVLGPIEDLLLFSKRVWWLEKSRFVLLDPFFHNACLIHLNSFSLSLDVIHQHLLLLLLLLSFSCFPGVVLLFYDGSLLPLSLSNLAKTLKSCCFSVSQWGILGHGLSQSGFSFFFLYSASPPIRPCKATTKTPHSSTNPFDIHSCISIIHPNV